MLTSNLPVKGMNQDVLEKFLPEGAYKFALNSVVETEQGDLNSISNELGNITCASGFPTNKTIIGHVLTDSDDVILFLFDPITERPDHEIGIFHSDRCFYETIGKGECLNFNREKQVNAIFRVRNGCERFVYFTDASNPYRVINITDTSDWVTPGTTFISSCDRIRFSRPYIIPQVSGNNTGSYNYGVADSGGELEYGTYSFFIRLIDKEGNPTDWINFSRYFPIGSGREDASYASTTYNQYNGAVNESSEKGYKSISTKSIKLNITSLDSDYVKYQLAVLKRTSSSGAITGVDLLSEVNYTTTNATFVYSGNSSQLVGKSTLEDLFSEKVKLEKIVAHTQTADRLFVANTELTTKDYTGFQRHASAIQVKWQHTEIPQGPPISALPKSNYQYEQVSGFLHDEVYALGIVYVHNDGEESPVFHIPGRAPNIIAPGGSNNAYISDGNPLDTHTLTTADLNVFDDSVLTRWKVYNTYTKDTPSALAGYMGYYETSTNYPVVSNSCDTHVDGYWGRDYEGNLLTTSTKIRHHRMPLLSARSTTGTDAHYHCGATFTMPTDYPTADIVGHYYVAADRTGNETVLDTGIMTHCKQYSTGNMYVNLAELISNPQSALNTDSDALFASSKTVYKEQYVQGQYVRVMKVLGGRVAETLNSNPPGGTVNRFTQTISNGQSFLIYPQTYTVPSSFNYNVISAVELPKNQNYLAGDISVRRGSTPITTGNGNTIYNASSSLSMQSMTLDRKISEIPTAPFYVAIKAERDVYTDLFNLNYKRTHNIRLVKLEEVTSVDTIYAGDVFVTSVEFNEIDFIQTSSTAISGSFGSYTFYADQEINPAFRMTDDRTNGQYSVFKHAFVLSGSYGDYLLNHMANKLYLEGDTIGWYPENHLYSEAYSNIQGDKIYLSLPRNHDFCSSCKDDKSPYKIYYSEQDTLESDRDYFLTIRPNNYRELSGSTGVITDLFTNKDNMYALTTNTAYYIPYQAQRLTSDINDIYIGSGEVFSTNPREFKSTDFSFGGCNHFKSRIVTEYGPVYIDSLSGRVILLGEGLNDISNNGMRSFFQNEGKLLFLKEFKQYLGYDYPHISSSSPVGIGYLTTYDPRYKRVIIHKRDFNLTAYAQSIFNSSASPITNDTLWFDGNAFKYRNSFGLVTTVTFENGDFFENKSFTISYSFITSSWISFHSYLPYYMFNNYRTFFSNGLYEHSAGEYQNYYEVKYPHTIDVILNAKAGEMKQFSNITYSSSSLLYDPIKGDFSNAFTTFDEAILYNSRGMSGKVKLVKNTPTSNSLSPFLAYVSRVDNYYNINNIRDNSISSTLPYWDKSWDTIGSSPFSFIDKVPNPANIKTNVNLWEDKRFRDTYLGVRLSFNPPTNNKISTDIISFSHESKTR